MRSCAVSAGGQQLRGRAHRGPYRHFECIRRTPDPCRRERCALDDPEVNVGGGEEPLEVEPRARSAACRHGGGEQRLQDGARIPGRAQRAPRRAGIECRPARQSPGLRGVDSGGADRPGDQVTVAREPVVDRPVVRPVDRVDEVEAGVAGDELERQGRRRRRSGWISHAHEANTALGALTGVRWS